MMSNYQLFMLCLAAVAFGITILSSRIGRHCDPKKGNDITPYGPPGSNGHCTITLPPGM